MKTRYLLPFLFAAIAFTGCKKNTGSLPTVITYSPQYIASKQVTLEYRVTSDGGQTLLSSGIYIGILTVSDTSWSKNPITGSDTGLYIMQVSGLTPTTKYFVKAYAANAIGEVFGTTVNFTTPALIKDPDNNDCEVVIIADQTWMLNNLHSTRYGNGDQIPTTTPVTFDISGENTPLYMWFANGDYATSQTYGLLYTWYAVTDSRNVCPLGWHVPTDADWTKLEDNLGSYLFAGSSLKEYGTSHWLAPYNTDATNISCFTALPAGYRPATGTFELLQNEAHFWSSTPSEASKAWERSLSAGSYSVTRQGALKNSGLSVRCIKD